MSVKRHSAAQPCRVCGGHDKLPQGQGIRCFGFETDDGWVHCTREGGGKAPYHESSTTWAHRAVGRCPCGTSHGEDPSELPPPRRPAPPQRAEVRELGEAKRAEIEATYDYVDREGRLLFEVVRYRPKTFRQRRPHPARPGRWVWHLTSCADYNAKQAADRQCDCGLPAQPLTLYRIPEIISGLEAGDSIWIVEGEKDADAMREAGVIATTNAGGVGKWNPAFAGLFAKHAQPGGAIRIVQDIDPETHKDGRPHLKGQQHARAVYDSLRAALPDDVSVSIVEPAEGKDAADHLAAGLAVEDFRTVYPAPAALLDQSPAAFKRAILRDALTMTEGALERAAVDAPPERPPQFRSPLRGTNGFAKMQGVVTVAGAPSAGKSFFAIACAIDNALDQIEPWDVFYLSCEMGRDYVLDRALRAAASHDLSFYECMSPATRSQAVEWASSMALPSNFTLVEVGIGVTMPEVIEFLAENVSDQPTLVVLDSISSLADNMEDVAGDAFGMTNLKTVQRYATAVRRLTRGHVSWLILSELNKEGRAKGRSLDHRSDLAISMVPDPDNGRIKRIAVTKSWFSETGPLGDFALQPEIARLTKVDPNG